MARRVAAILLTSPDLDANYEAVKSAAFAWPRSERAGTSDAAD